jgi:coenzyme F420 hydrogenase subunit beta
MNCPTCVDYTNVLADLTVGYVGGEGEQWLIVRNARGEERLSLLGNEVRLSKPTSAGKRPGPAKGLLANTEDAAGGLPLRRMPDFLRLIVG